MSKFTLVIFANYWETLPAFFEREATPPDLQIKLYLLLMIINFSGNLDMFPGGYLISLLPKALAPRSGRIFTPFLFLRTKKGRVPKGRSPLCPNKVRVVSSIYIQLSWKYIGGGAYENNFKRSLFDIKHNSSFAKLLFIHKKITTQLLSE